MSKINLANKLTLLRVLLVPVFIVLLEIDSLWTSVAAFIVFAAASITDFFDGQIARKYNTITTFGIFLDPLADKLLITSAFVCFVGMYTLSIPAWMVICIIAREFVITGLRFIASSKNISIPASIHGKFKTTSQIVAIVVILLIIIIKAILANFYFTTPYDLFELTGFSYFAGWCLLKLPYWLMLAVTVLTLYSGVVYMLEHKKIFQEE
ncbi:CDP-diacylglycerol--glycerol-3-phosphate 3-phosphatidyltransferase [Candidatus Ruminimicrobium bovinum]|uniref:CDP-diacylglycerol--glycerol-3-phosphate 3-phosphatidyltransferase n=1 Tax=Candidatus Ruminimicrobium bovinum TaxID=3242779 RepID=UPI0039B98420